MIGQYDWHVIAIGMMLHDIEFSPIGENSLIGQYKWHVIAIGMICCFSIMIFIRPILGYWHDIA